MNKYGANENGTNESSKTNGKLVFSSLKGVSGISSKDGHHNMSSCP